MSATSSTTSTARRDLARTLVSHLDAAVRDESFIVGARVRRLEEYVCEVTGRSAVGVSSAAVGLLLVRQEQFGGAPSALAPDAGGRARSIVAAERRLVQRASVLWQGGRRPEGAVLVRDFGSGAEAGPGAAGIVELIDVRQLGLLDAGERSTAEALPGGGGERSAADALVVHGPHDYSYGAGDFGIVVCAEPVAERLRVLRNHGRGGLGTYLHAEVGFNNRMDEAQAGLLLDRLTGTGTGAVTR
ncbi:DegT/DnrJ/EryC1/StrS family aminotransferase [Streptomyces sp. NPDC005925]|uniref:DegT/DnrJ/EryC1/StrS family aminotransferase n=1 Tax=Streptomyces sp. NPDC005925 TaxID=3157172 RepID=UPI0033D0A07A